jgi:tetratricopeptide (TPR) repeat protein
MEEQAMTSPVKLMPEYVTVLPGGATVEPMVEAPVLALEGLDPWSAIAGPALALEEAPEGTADGGATYVSPHQLELEPWRPDAADAAETHAAQPDEGSDEAPVEAEPVIPSPPDPSEQLYARARTAADDGRPGEAMALYRELIAQNPRHVRARNNLALLLDASSDHQGALAELDHALEQDAEHTTLLTNRGALLGAQGRYAAAERDLRRVLRVEPSNVEALFNLGVVMTKKGLWSEAAPLLRRATELDPSRGPAYYYLGESLNHVDDLAGALAAYQRAAELQPSNARALYGLGIIYDRLARPDDAAAMYRKSREVGRR